MTEPIRLTSNEFWGRKSGSWDRHVPKGLGGPVGRVFWQRRGPYKARTSARDVKTPQALLARQAMEKGWLNGRKLVVKK